MADRNLLVRILGDSSSLERAFKKSTAATATFERQTRGASSRTQASFAKLNSIKFLAGGLLATGAVAGLKSVVQAAAQSQQVLGQTRVALEATGTSWARYGKQIEGTVKAQSRLGFDDEALLQTFSLFQRQTNNVTQSLKENQLAMDVARARFISLEQAANLVNKAALGQAGALRRLGIDTKGATSGTELLTLLTEKYGGAAQAAGKDASTAFDRAQVSIQNAKEEIGGNLLPTVAGLATTLADTLDLLNQLGQVKIPPIRIPMVFDFGGGTVGSFAHKAIFTLPEFVTLTKDVVNNLLDNWRQATDTATADAASQFEDILNGFTSNVINDALDGAKVPDVKAKVKGFGTGLKPSDLFGPLVKQIPAALEESLLRAQSSGNQSRIRAALAKILTVMTSALDDPRLNRAGRIQILGIINSIKGQIGAIDEAVKAAADSAKADRADRASKAAQKRADAIAKIAEANKKAAEAAKKAAAAAKAAAQASQFRRLGLTAEGDRPTPTIPTELKELASLRQRIIGTRVDTPRVRAQLARIEKVLTDPIHKATDATRKAIQEMFAAIRSEFEKGSKQGPLTKTEALRPDRILAGLGLDPQTAKTLRARLSGFNTAGVAISRPTGTTAFGQVLPPVVVNVTTTLDGAVVAQNTTKHQQTKARRNPWQKRGPWTV